MTWEEFLEQDELHSECDNSEWYDEPEADPWTWVASDGLSSD